MDLYFVCDTIDHSIHIVWDGEANIEDLIKNELDLIEEDKINFIDDCSAPISHQTYSITIELKYFETCSVETIRKYPSRIRSIVCFELNSEDVIKCSNLIKLYAPRDLTDDDLLLLPKFKRSERGRSGEECFGV